MIDQHTGGDHHRHCQFTVVAQDHDKNIGNGSVDHVFLHTPDAAFIVQGAGHTLIPPVGVLQ